MIPRTLVYGGGKGCPKRFNDELESPHADAHFFFRTCPLKSCFPNDPPSLGPTQPTVDIFAGRIEYWTDGIIPALMARLNIGPTYRSSPATSTTMLPSRCCVGPHISR